MSSQTGPHDAVFRRILGEPANAASQLRAVLPPALTSRLDLEQLARVPASFVDDSLQWRHSDLLFTAPTPGAEAFLYVLIEHQSSTDPLMPFRMLQYMVRIWDYYLRERPGATRLPAVIPLVVHHDRRRWSGPTQLRDLLQLDSDTAEAAREFLPEFRFLLDDLVCVDEGCVQLTADLLIKGDAPDDYGYHYRAGAGRWVGRCGHGRAVDRAAGGSGSW